MDHRCITLHLSSKPQYLGDLDFGLNLQHSASEWCECKAYIAILNCALHAEASDGHIAAPSVWCDMRAGNGQAG